MKRSIYALKCWITAPLTNLETDTKKLLQVILIGQPELQLLLKRQELRQLAQDHCSLPFITIK